MIKTISISPETLRQWLLGKSISPAPADVPRDARVVRSGCNPKTGEFWAQVESPSFDAPGAPRLPQEFIMQTQ